jgi:hypothetical protein
VRAVWPLAAAFLLLLPSACATAETEAGSALREAEIEWVADYSAWSADFLEELGREAAARQDVLNDPAAFEEYVERSARLRGCLGWLEDDLGDPPTARLRPTLSGLGETCALVAPAVERLAGATDAAARTGPYLDAGQSVDRAALHWAEVDATLDTLMRARGPLPRLGGSATRSRIEPTLTGVAEQVADGRSVEVRCWSDEDWRRVLDEEEALTNGQLTVDTVGAFAVRATGTVHLQQSDCAILGRLAYDHWAPTEPADLDRVAETVSTLSHEIQHIVNSAGEAETECAAVQHNSEVALALGATQAYARVLADRYWERLYPPDADGYASDECRPGGTLDLAPETPSWPTG